MPQGAFLTFFSSSRTLDLGAVFFSLHFFWESSFSIFTNSISDRILHCKFGARLKLEEEEAQLGSAAAGRKGLSSPPTFQIFIFGGAAH